MNTNVLFTELRSGADLFNMTATSSHSPIYSNPSSFSHPAEVHVRTLPHLISLTMQLISSCECTAFCYFTATAANGNNRVTSPLTCWKTRATGCRRSNKLEGSEPLVLKFDNLYMTIFILNFKKTKCILVKISQYFFLFFIDPSILYPFF